MVLNRRQIAFGEDERVIDAIEAEAEWGWIKTIFCGVLTIFTLGINFFCLHHCLPKNKQWFVITDRRIISISNITKGLQGSSTTSKLVQYLNFWMIPSMDEGEFHVTKSCCGLCLGKEHMSIKVKVVPGGTIRVVPKVSMKKTRNFLRSFITVNTPYILAGIAPVKPEEIQLLSRDILLMKHEYIIGGVKCERKQMPAKYRVPLLLLTCCFFPRRKQGVLIATPARLIEMSTVSLPLTGEPIAYQQNFWFLRSITRWTLYTEENIPCKTGFLGKFYEEQINIGIDTDEVINKSDWPVEFSFSGTYETAENARFFMALLAICHMKTINGMSFASFKTPLELIADYRAIKEKESRNDGGPESEFILQT